LSRFAGLDENFTMAELPKNAPNDFVKSLFWSFVLVGLVAALIVALLFWYYHPTLEYVR
jgi:cobalamin synthase